MKLNQDTLTLLQANASAQGGEAGSMSVEQLLKIATNGEYSVTPEQLKELLGNNPEKLNTNFTDALRDQLSSNEEIELLQNLDKSNNPLNAKMQAMGLRPDAQPSSDIELLLQGDLNASSKAELSSNAELNQSLKTPMSIKNSALAQRGPATQSTIEGKSLAQLDIADNSELFVANKNIAQASKPSLNRKVNLTQNFLKNANDTGVFSQSRVQNFQSVLTTDESGMHKVNIKNNVKSVKNDGKKEQVLTDQLSFNNENSNVERLLPNDLAVNSISKSELSNNSGSKIFKLETLQSTDLTNINEVINKISDYIIQSRTSSQPRVEMSLQHQDMGQMDIIVERMQKGSDDLNIIIRGQSEQVRSLLSNNSTELMSNLARAGVQVADLKLEVASSNNSQMSNQFGSSEQGARNGQQQFGSENNQRNHDSQRRQELWDILSEGQAA